MCDFGLRWHNEDADDDEGNDYDEFNWNDCDEFNWNITEFTGTGNEQIYISGRGTFAAVEKGFHNGDLIGTKKIHETLSEDVAKIFAKEAFLLSQIKCNVLDILALCETPPAIMIEYLEFSLLTFRWEITVNSLDRLLGVFHKQDLLSYFPCIGNQITTDVINALSYLHENNTVDRDIKPSNVIVSNSHYRSCRESELAERFSKQPIICKLGDLGEARSIVAKTCIVPRNTWTRFINRGSPAFMAAGVQIEGQLLESV